MSRRHGSLPCEGDRRPLGRLTSPAAPALLKPHLYLSPKRGAVAEQPEEKKIHVRLDGDLHRRLRIRCAELELTIQDYVVRLLQAELRSSDDQPAHGGPATDRTQPGRRASRAGRRR